VSELLRFLYTGRCTLSYHGVAKKTKNNKVIIFSSFLSMCLYAAKLEKKITRGVILIYL
jgi:hypothetical protein